MIRLRVAAGALAGVGLGACFTPPGGPVLFSCEPDGRSACPPGYECRDDGCCHDVDTPEDANLGECMLAPAGTAATEDSGSDSGSDTGTSSGTDTGTSSGTDTGTSSGTDTGDSTTAASDSGTTAGT